jgi:hypothetical protein
MDETGVVQRVWCVDEDRAQLVGAYSGYCGRSSVISNQDALLRTKV